MEGKNPERDIAPPHYDLVQVGEVEEFSSGHSANVFTDLTISELSWIHPQFGQFPDLKVLDVEVNIVPDSMEKLQELLEAACLSHLTPYLTACVKV